MDYKDKNNQQIEEKKENTVTFAQKVGHFMGSAFFAVATGCVMALLIALTMKLIFWII